ncbi:predicted protein [Naegleria gruberi]|uniref:U6 snRNA-associated Sm-like protein LSm1 n=1 Tax=Naegleria gruberi TaxID=5762 RepID=D2VHU6_NAEGR|nr:uncharacterized protein NAEGRDRAFT_34170 [Naegleria gruberi]EFC43738.1 predicted protein [Naegleria gruberi]|eukprot:XP_002676482.1 predicted protein [Naegleria gruberi strain NEG-M]
MSPQEDDEENDELKVDFYFPGAASLSDQLDKKVMVILRDGKKLIGILRCYDQFVNMTLEKTVERIVVEDKYGDLDVGLYIVRGENVVLMGEVDESRDLSLKQVPVDEILMLSKLEQEKEEERSKLKQLHLRNRGKISISRFKLFILFRFT